MNRRGFIAVVSAGTAALAQGPRPDIAGTWQGALSTPGGSLRLAIDISKTSDGLYVGTLTSIDQGGARIPIDIVTLTGNSARFELKAVNGVFEGTVDAAGSKLTGTWTQGGPELPLELTRSKNAADNSEPSSAPAPETFPLGIPLDVFVPVAPTPFPAKGRTHLVYELHITNFDLGGRDLLLKRIDVLEGGTPLAGFEGSELIGIMAPVAAAGKDKRVLKAGGRAVAYMWVSVDTPARLPAELRHRIAAGNDTVDCGRIAISKQQPPVLASPLAGAGWVALNGPGNGSLHRRAILAVNGRAQIGQRFAIDWVKIGNGRTFDGDEKQNKAHFAYGSTTEPHLHFQVSDANSVVASEGLPYVLAAWRNELPLQNDRVNF